MSSDSKGASVETGTASDACKRSVLFIGGLADGQRRPAPESLRWMVAGDMPSPSDDHGICKPFEYVQDRAVYRRESLKVGREEWAIYVLDSLSTVQAVGKLVRGYRPRDADLD